MPTLNERVGRATLDKLDYVGGLSIQLWAALRALRVALPITGNRYRLRRSRIAMDDWTGHQHRNPRQAGQQARRSCNWDKSSGDDREVHPLGLVKQ